jgi:hypothetical protein
MIFQRKEPLTHNPIFDFVGLMTNDENERKKERRYELFSSNPVFFRLTLSLYKKHRRVFNPAQKISKARLAKTAQTIAR